MPPFDSSTSVCHIFVAAVLRTAGNRVSIFCLHKVLESIGNSLVDGSGNTQVKAEKSNFKQTLRTNKIKRFIKRCVL